MKHNTHKGWVYINGKNIYFKSLWEVEYAIYLQFLKDSGIIMEWEYEPKIFRFPGIKSKAKNYKPDFRLTGEDGTVVYHEVKGFMFPKAKLQLNRMRIYYPEEVVVVIRGDWFKENKQLIQTLKEIRSKNKDVCTV